MKKFDSWWVGNMRTLNRTVISQYSGWHRLLCRIPVIRSLWNCIAKGLTCSIPSTKWAEIGLGWIMNAIYLTRHKKGRKGFVVMISEYCLFSLVIIFTRNFQLSGVPWRQALDAIKADSSCLVSLKLNYTQLTGLRVPMKDSNGNLDMTMQISSRWLAGIAPQAVEMINLFSLSNY